MRKPALSFVLLWSLAGSIVAAADKPKLPEGPGKATTERLCGTCHAAALVMGKRESRDGWSGIVEDMIQRGMKGTDDEYGEVVDYLVANFSKSATPAKLNVNKATAKGLSTGLGISDDQAAAVVQYRETNGNFKSIEDLQKVPGLDARAIEQKKDKLEFQ